MDYRFNLTPGFYQMLDDQEIALKAKGYDEESLNCPDRPGKFMQRLDKGFSKAITDAEFSRTPESFFLDISGFFDQNKDMVYFKFHYQYDHSKSELQTKSLYATMDGFEKIFFMAKTEHMPGSKQVYDILCNQRKMKVAKEILKKPTTGKQRKL